MERINRLAPSTDVFVEIEADDELGAPADPTSLVIDIAFSATRRLGNAPTWLTATWWTHLDAIPPRRYAKFPVTAGMLAEGVWWPFVRVNNGSSRPIVAGDPFRVE